MAQANLQFKIGSTFSGEGFKQAQTAVGNVKKAAQPALTATNSLSQAFHALSTSSNQAAAAVGSLLGAFAQGGIQAAVITGALAAWNLAVNKFYENAKKAADAAKEMSDALWNNAHGAFSDEMASRMSRIKNEVDGIRKHFDTITSQANAFRDAMNGLQSSRAEGGVIALQIEKFNAMLEADSEALRNDIEATYNLKIAKEQAKNVEEQSAAKVQSATDARTQSEDRIRVIDDQLQTLETRRAQLEDELNTLKESDLVSRRDVKKKIDELNAKEIQLDADLQAEIENKKVLLVKEQTAIQDAANANDKMKLAVEEAAQKITAAGVQWEQSNAAEFICATQAQLDADRRADAKDLAQQATRAQQTLKEANANVKEATANAKQALDNYNDNFTQNRMWEAIQGAATNGANGISSIRGDVLKQSQQIAQGAADIAVQRGLADGSIRTVSGMQLVANEAARQSRIDQSNKENSQAMQEAARAARLEKMSDKAMSKSDKDWLAKYKKVKEANEAEKKKLEQAKAEEIEAKRAQQQAQLNIREIRDKIMLMNIDGVENELAGINDKIANLAIK